MSWVAVATTVVGAGVSAYSAHQQSQKAKAAAGATVKVGDKPKAAEYQPVDFNQEQLATILGNLQNQGATNALTDSTNANITAQDLFRARKLIPGYKQMMKMEGQNARSLLGGQLPFDDVLALAADRSSATGALGIPGTAGPATLRDLGLSRLDAMKTGSGLMQNMVSMADQISPVSRYATGREMQLSPADRIRMAMSQNEKIQESDQSKYNIEAGVSPTDQANQMLRLSAGSSTPDYSAAAIQALGGLASAYRGYQSSNSLNTAGAGTAGLYGSTYVGSMGNSPVYRPQSIPA